MIFTSIFGILTLVLMARALGFSKAPVLDAVQAREVAAHALQGFRPADVALDSAGRGALVAGSDGRVALVRPHGDRWVVRIIDRAEAEGTRLTLRPREPMFAATTLDLGKASASWARRLA